MSLLSPAQLKEKFPWMNTDGVVLASYGELVKMMIHHSVEKKGRFQLIFNLFGSLNSTALGDKMTFCRLFM